MQDDGWILEVKEELSSMAADEEASMDTPSTWLGDPLLGRAIEHGRYHVEQALGWGGSSTVYKVRRVLTGQHRAMKVLHRNLMFDDEAQERFIVEARLLDQLDHPNIVRYYDAGLLEETEQPYLLMEMLEGQSLHDAIWATGEPLLPPPEDAVILSIQIASALAHAHARGVLHRDLKPENVILMTPHEEHPRIIPRVKLIDFGIAASLDADTHPEDVILGTPEYAAPEQFEDRATFDARLDIYQLGAVLHFMLTGRTPHPEGDDNFLKVYVAQLTYKDGPGPRPSRLRPELQRYIGLDALVARMLSNDRDLRPMTASDALEAL
ncbi:MAG: serine/threonine-protein kinase, partial [Myxococcota bacterium]